MKAKYLLGASISAIVLSGVGFQPAMAQDTGSVGPDTTSQNMTPEQVQREEAKKKEVVKDSAGRAIVVTGRRKALETATEIKKHADTIVDSVVADEAGQLPDNSITEVLQRVPGITLSRFTAANGGSTQFQIEGTGFSVRGLPYTTSTVNGQQVFSANGASAISWGEVTPELMAGVDVYKASRADMIEGGSSLVDLRTHLPFDFTKTEFDVSLGASYGDQSKKTSPNISALFSKRFNTSIGEIGVLWDFAFNRLYQQSSDLQVGAMFGEYAPSAPTDNHIALVPNGFSWSTSQNKRDRYGAFQAIQWKPASNLTFTNTVFFSEYVSDSLGQSGGFGLTPDHTQEIMPQPGSNPVYDSAGAFQSGTLVLGSTGNASFGNNTTAADLEPDSWKSWFPTEALNISCGGAYGDPVSNLVWNWGNWPNIISCAPAQSSLNPGGGTSASHYKNSTLDISQSFDWTPGDRVRVRGGGQYVYSRSSGQDMYIGTASVPPPPGDPSTVNSANVDLTGSLPTVSGLNLAGMEDPSTHYFSSMAYHAPNNTGKMFAAHLDVDYRVSDDGLLRGIRLGARMANRTEKDNFIGTYWVPLGASWLNNIQYLDTINPADYQVTNFPHFFGGQQPAPSPMLVASPSLVQSMDWYHVLSTYNNTIAGGTPSDYWAMIDDGQGLALTNSRIKNVAGYVEANFAHDRMGFLPAFSGNIGVRVFHEQLRASGYLSTPTTTQPFVLTEADSALISGLQAPGGSASGAYPTTYMMVGEVTPQTRNYSYTRVLPSFNIRFDLSPKFIVRGAASIASSPPNLGDIRAGGSISPIFASTTDPTATPVLTGVKVNGGGANLKPVKITSEDLSFEYYPKRESLFHLDLFAKQIKDQELFYSFTANNLPFPVVALSNGATDVAGGTPATLNVPWLYLQNKTSPVLATMKGFEFGARTFFDKLPGLLRGIGVEGNVTYIDSHSPAQQANNVLSPYTPYGPNGGGLNPDGTVPHTYSNLPYPGLSKWTYNVQLLYSLGRVNMRAAYNWRSKALLSTNVNPLSYATSGGNPYILNTSPTNFDATHSYPVYNMIPAWIASAGYLDLGFDYKFSSVLTISAQANNILNTKSRTLQEPLPGVFEPYDNNVSDRRFSISARMHF